MFLVPGLHSKCSNLPCHHFPLWVNPCLCLGTQQNHSDGWSSDAVCRVQFVGPSQSLRAATISLPVPSLNLNLKLSGVRQPRLQSHLCSMKWESTAFRHFGHSAFQPRPCGTVVLNEKCSTWMIAFRSTAKSCFPWYHWCKHEAF